MELIGGELTQHRWIHRAQSGGTQVSHGRAQGNSFGCRQAHNIGTQSSYLIRGEALNHAGLQCADCDRAEQAHVGLIQRIEGGEHRGRQAGGVGAQGGQLTGRQGFNHGRIQVGHSQ